MDFHLVKRPYACSFPGCSYRGKTKSQITQHKATHGLGYVYACDFCDYRATTSTNLRRHSRLHFDTRPYRCPHCSHTFVELSALRRHVLDSAYHPGLPLYVCPWCTNSSSNSNKVVTNANPSSSLIIDSPISKKISSKKQTVQDICGFNSSSLAWKHVVQAHAAELSDPETLRRMGRKSGETLIEHDVSLIFGLYYPNEDGKFRPSSAVRMLNGPAPPYQRINASHRKRSENNSTHSTLTISNNFLTEDGSGEDGGGGGETLKFAEVQDLVTLAGGFVWSSAAFQSGLVRATSQQSSRNPQH
ncbi:unnamed protein product [Rodentolepis nana]|uniref:C2H2-type domain-containing protein n=1 Tax=Rodentolepis nana TaxID=102285 RepID=A0A0R3TPU6_RODNA|nr:unnamed protein product [Rodentolepis nana]